MMVGNKFETVWDILFSKAEHCSDQRKLKKFFKHISVVPGCGKTMLMDMFYENVPLENKQRIHFNAFMMDVHSRK